MLNFFKLLLILLIVYSCDSKNESPKIIKYYNEKNLDSMVVVFEKAHQRSVYKQINKSMYYIVKNYKNNILVSEGDLLNAEIVKDSIIFVPNQYMQTFYPNSNLVHKRNIWTADVFSIDRTSLYMTFDEKSNIIKDSSHTFIINKKENKLAIDFVSCCVSTNTLYLLEDKKLDSIISKESNKWLINLDKYKNINHIQGFIKNQNLEKLKKTTGITNDKSEFLYMLNE